MADLWSYDIEVYSNFFSAAFKELKTGERKLFLLSPYRTSSMSFSEFKKFLLTKDRWFMGFNNSEYDDVIVGNLISLSGKDFSLYNQIGPDGEHLLTTWLNSISEEIILYREMDEAQKFIKKGRRNAKFMSLDLKKICRLFKSLKSAAINLKWPLIQDLPIKVGSLIHEHQIDRLLRYGDNDVDITEAIFLHGKIAYGASVRDEINLRVTVSKKFGVDVMNEDRSGIANRLIENFYSKATGTSIHVFKQFRTGYKQGIDLKDCIPKDVRFRTPKLQSLLNEIRQTHVWGKDDKTRFRVPIGDTLYDIAKGGIHSSRGLDGKKKRKEIFVETADILLVDCDVSSYYPRNMIKNRIYPAHLNPVFIQILITLTSMRLEAKARGDKVTAEALKIVINSIYGKLGDHKYWLYDLKAMYRVTLSGQLYLLMLIERLEEAGFEVFYANTDGITTKVPKSQKHIYDAICNGWMKYIGFDLEFVNYKKAIIRDVNNYLVFYDDPKKGPQVKMKGDFDTERWQDLGKAFDMPIIPIAVRNFFENGIPVDQTINGHKDILDFCMSQNADASFSFEVDRRVNGRTVTEVLQKTNRYLIGTHTDPETGAFYKTRNNTRSSVASTGGQVVRIMNDVRKGLDDVPVNRPWYIRQAQEQIGPFIQAQQGSLFA